MLSKLVAWEIIISHRLLAETTPSMESKQTQHKKDKASPNFTRNRKEVEEFPNSSADENTPKNPQGGPFAFLSTVIE